MNEREKLANEIVVATIAGKVSSKSLAIHLIEAGYLPVEEVLKKLKQAVLDNRTGKPLDLTEAEFELFWLIYNDGVAKFVEFHPLGKHD